MSNATEPAAQLTPLKRAFLAIEELQARLDRAERARHEPVAIVGVGCRLPGGVDTPEAFWRLLRDGVDAIDAIPPGRWDVDAYYDPDYRAPGKMAQRHGGFLRDVDRFDPQFFGIAPREAASMDPQQRLLLEVTWEALERAGLAPGRLAGSATGVFVAMASGDYHSVHLSARGLDGLDAYFASGVAHSIASGRISYVLGLEGPSLTVDTACSSSLVAVHLAVQSLRGGECRTAIAGAVNLILTPETSITLSKYQMLAPDGRCKFGDARADGFVRGEGCAALVLKRLSDALSDGDPVLAVIRGSALNQDGASSGLTAPNGPSQEAVIRAALADGRVAPAAVSYVEAHGTGTALGDPIELQALGAVFGQSRPADQPLVVGSVKTNVGHLEAVAGMAGLIKLALMLQHGQIPPSLHFATPSPHIPWDELPLRVPTALEPWQAAGPRLAGVSSFGFSGTNAHLVLEAPPAPAAPVAGDERPAHLLALSAKSAPALRSLAASYAAALAAGDAPAIADTAFTANSGRSHFAHRLAVVAADGAAAAAALEAFGRGEAAPGLVARHAERADPPKVAFLFTGQGAQYAGMGRELYRAQPVFRAALDRCAAILAAHLERPLLELLFAEPGSPAAALLDHTTYTQPALVALQVALVELWRSWGVEPAALLGHSIGEYAAAIVAGVLSLEDGLALVAARGRLMGALPAGGAMAAVFAPAAAVEAALAEQGGGAVVAAYNGPEHIVVAGAEAAVAALVEGFTAAGVRAQRLNVSHAFHSPLLDPMLAELERAAAGVALHPPRLRVVSNLSGAAAGAEIVTPAYWRRHAREPVRFAQGVEQLARLGCELFVEIGPHPTLLGMAQAALPPGAGVWLPSLRRGRDDWQVILDSLAGAYTCGVAVDWAGFDRPYGRRKLILPTYPFQRERYWVEPRRGAHRADRRAAHPLLGRRLRSPLRQVQFEQELWADELPFLADHRVFGTSILPATGFVEAALAAGAEVGPGVPALDDVAIHAALPVGENEQRTVHVIVSPDDGGASFELLSQGGDEEPWRLHASGRMAFGARATPERADLDAIRTRCPAVASGEEHYALLAGHGLDFGPSLRGVRRVCYGPGEALAEIALPEAHRAELAAYRFHPALLDACLQALAWLAKDGDATYLPIGIEGVTLHAAPAGPVWSHAALRSGGAPAEGPETLAGDVWVYDEGGAPVAEVRGILMRRAGREALLGLGGSRLADWLYEPAWRRLPDAPAEGAPVELPAPAVALAGADAASPALRAEHRLDEHQGLLDALEALSGDYAAAALAELGVRLVPGEGFGADDLGVLVRHRRLLDRLLAGLAGDGLLRRDGASWVVSRPFTPGDLAARCDELLARHPRGSGELAITRRCGEGLAAALRGDADPLQLLFPGGSTEAAEQMYRESPFAHFYNSLAGEAVAAAVAALPAGRKLRVLEIGAGTGGTTAYVLPRLPAGRAEYTFTDISPLFLARARETFAAYPFVGYGALDIEADPAAQGFAPHSYDIVVAANVLHATADLRRTFGHVARLLAPGGLLVLLEMTRPQRFIDISFGLTPGWWKLDDADLRPDYLLLDRPGWLGFLAAAGFGEAVAAPGLVPGGRADLSLQTLFVARAPARAGLLPEGRRSWLIFADAGGVGEGLAGLIAGRGGRAVLVAPGAAYDQPSPGRFVLDPARPGEFARVLSEASEPPFDGAVYLWGLDGACDRTPVAGQARSLGGALHLAQALAGVANPPPLWVVTRGAQGLWGAAPDPAQAPLWGLGKVVALEHPELRCARVDLDPAAAADGALALLGELLAADGEDEVAVRDGARYGARLARCPAAALAGPAAPQPVRLELPRSGVLDELALRPVERPTPGPGEVVILVHAAGLNFRDVMNALAMRDDQQPAGGECAGVVAALGPGVRGFAVGDPVVAVAPGCFGTFATTVAELVAPMPSRLSFEQAATLPLAFLTAHYALHGQARVAPGETVLIHAAAGGVGLAAVQLARRAGAVVIGSAGSPRKRAYLAGLGLAAVTDSRSLVFVDEVLAHTGGRGVDVVLNSLTGEFIPRGLGLLAPGGRFVELGKREVLDAEQVRALGPGLSYHTVALAEDLERRPALVGPLLRELVAAVAAGELEPLPGQSFELADAAAAFRFMAQARHIGKVVLARPEATAELPAGPPPLRPDGAYLITGGLGGLGLLTAEWLAARGARHLVLMGRSAPGQAAEAAIARIEARGARVLVLLADVSRREQVAGALARIEADGAPLRGVIHSAGVLADGALLRQDWAGFERVLAPKVDGAWHLHELTLGRPLDFFVLFSSAASLFGSRGQANHAAANSFLDALATWRRAHGLPGLSINWGAWSEVGSAAALAVGERISTQGVGTIAPDQGLAALAALMGQGRPQLGVAPVDWELFLRQFAPGAAPRWLAEVARQAPRPAATRVEPQVAFAARLAAAPPAQQPQLLMDFVAAQVARVLGVVSAQSVGERRPLSEQGLDSLMAVELRNLIGTGLGLDRALPATLVFDYPTVEALAGYLARLLAPPAGAQPDTPPAQAEAAPVAGGAGLAEMLDVMEDLSDDEVDRLFAERLQGRL